MPISWIGEMMTPRSRFCDVSGVRFLFPPFNPSPCELQVAGVNGATAEGGVALAFTQSGFPCPMVPEVEAVKKGGEYSWKSEGARKPVETAPLKVRKSTG